MAVLPYGEWNIDKKVSCKPFQDRGLEPLAAFQSINIVFNISVLCNGAGGKA